MKVKWNCQYNVIITPQTYIEEELKEELSEIFKSLCALKKVKIIDGAITESHVHARLKISPEMAVDDFVLFLKAESERSLFEIHPELKSEIGVRFWERGYYVSTCGTFEEEEIVKYLKEREESFEDEG
ncbi:MAG: IS200/IS605 family transposase [Clostridiales bacterium]|nr:IS200/IS605 family transposase [Clostridiales bacterium]